MPNIDSAQEARAQGQKHTLVNHARKTRVRGYIRKVEEAISSGDKTAALAALNGFFDLAGEAANAGLRAWLTVRTYWRVDVFEAALLLKAALRLSGEQPCPSGPRKPLRAATR